MIRRIAGWMLVIGLVFFVAYQPDQAATMFTKIGSSAGAIAVGGMDFLEGFADRVGNAKPDATPSQ